MNEESPDDLRKRAERLEREAQAAIKKAEIQTTWHNLFAPGKVLLVLFILIMIYCVLFGR